MLCKDIADRILPEWKTPLSQTHSSIDCYCPPIEFFTDLIDKKIPFGFCKLNHVFWETVSEKHDLESLRELMENELTRPLFGVQAGGSSLGWLLLHGFDLLEETLALIKSLNGSSVMFGASHLGPPDESLFVGHVSYERRLECIKASLPDGYIPLFGSLWKKYALDGSMPQLFEAIRDRRVVVVGLNHLAHINKYTEFSDFRHIEVTLDATKRRIELLDMFLHEWRPNDFWIFQAGETLSMWFICQMSKTNGQFLDVGRSLDMFMPSENLKLDSQTLSIIPDFYEQYWMQNRRDDFRSCERGGTTIPLGILRQKMEK